MNVKDLQFVRFHTDFETDPNGMQAAFLFKSIPRHLWELKDNTFKNLDNLYRIGPMIIQNPMTHLYVLSDPDKAIQGILWFTINVIEEVIEVFVFAIDPEYQKKAPSRGVLVFDLVWDFLRSLKLKISKVQFHTFKPNAYEKLGAQRSKKILMEIDLNVERPNRETIEPIKSE